MSKLPWFKCYPEKLLGALSVMDPDEGYLYVILLLRIYETNGGCADSVKVLAHRSNLSIARATKALDALLESGKIEKIGDVWANPAAVSELTSRRERIIGAKNSADARWKKDKQKQQIGNTNALRSRCDDYAIKIKIEDKKERKKDSRPVKKQDADVYSEEFEACWKHYPRTRNTSKKKAHDIYRMLNTENQKRVAAAIPIFAAAMKSEGRPEDKIAHMTTWLNGRMYETASVSGGLASVTPITDAWKTMKREQWEKNVQMWRNTSNWSAAWGPAPGRLDCAVPRDLFVENDKWMVPHHKDPRLAIQATEVNTQLTRNSDRDLTGPLAEPLGLADQERKP